MKNLIIFCIAALFSHAATAANVSASAQPVAACRSTRGGSSVCLQAFQLNVTLNINAADIGLPGLVYLAVQEKDGTLAYYSPSQQAWVAYTGGMIEPYLVYQGGLPPQVTFTTAKIDASPYVGTTVYVGYGALQQADQDKIDNFIASVGQANLNPLISMQHLQQTAVENDMRSNEKAAAICQISKSSKKPCGSY